MATKSDLGANLLIWKIASSYQLYYDSPRNDNPYPVSLRIPRRLVRDVAIFLILLIIYLRYNLFVTQKQYFVYILSNFTRTVLYVGVTDNLLSRINEHKNEIIKGFTQKYKVHYFIYYETCDHPLIAIEREKQIKSWSRKRKDQLIYKFNPALIDLYDSISK